MAKNEAKIKMIDRRPGDPGLVPWARAPLLQTENRDEFDALQKALRQEIKPKGVIEEMYVADIGHIVWEIVRLRRGKAGIISSALLPALKTILKQLSKTPPGPPLHMTGQMSDVDRKIEELAFDWFANSKARLEVSRRLEAFGLDESAIEACAIRAVAADLDRLENMLISLETRRDKLLYRIAEYRKSFAKRVRESADQIIDGECNDLTVLPNTAAESSGG
jgi:hypothetical protein